VYPRVGFLGRFGWGGSDLATGSLQNTHATTRMSPRKKLGVFKPTKLIFHQFAYPQAYRHISIFAVL